MKVKYRSNLVSGIVSVILGIICMGVIPRQIGEDYSATYGITSRTVPYAVAILWIVCGVVLMFQSLVLKKEEIKSFEVAKEVKALGYMAVLLIYAVLFTRSFLASTIFLGVATLIFTGSRKKTFYLIVLGVVVILYLLFSKVLHVQLP